MLLDRKLDAKEKKAKDFLALSVNMLGLHIWHVFKDETDDFVHPWLTV